MDGHLLEKVDQIRYLGVLLDQKLNWKGHLSYIQSKISKSSYLLAKLRHYVDLNTLKMIYYSSVYPYLVYCISSWGGIAKTTLLPLFRLQKRIIRIMTKSEFDAPSSPLFSKLQILPLEHIYNLNLAIIVHKFHKNKLPTPVNLIPIHHSHNHNTRLSNNKNYYQNFNRINLGQQTYISKGLKFLAINTP